MDQQFFSSALQQIKDEGRYRFFTSIERLAGDFPKASLHSNGSTKEVVVWCSNDYLGMGQNPKVIEAMQNALKHGAGTGGTRNISGNSPLHLNLEKKLAEFHGKESALVFSSGYVANQTVLSTLGKLIPNVVIFSDALNHASMIEGIAQSGAEKKIFKHNDPDDLERLLALYPIDRPKLVVFESVYSMEGDIAPIKELCEVASFYGAMTYVDEVHGLGLYGPKGAGVIDERGLASQVDIIQGNFGKTVGLMGGYIAANADIVDFIRSFASGFIFTTSLPPVLLAGALESLEQIELAHELRMIHRERVHTLKNKLSDAQIPFLDAESHIVPVMVGDAVRCKHASDLLLDLGIYVQPINFPTVARGTERLRITPTPHHTNEMIDHLVDSLCQVWSELSLRLAA
jgi:5-aminolevulinate synthase